MSRSNTLLCHRIFFAPHIRLIIPKIRFILQTQIFKIDRLDLFRFNILIVKVFCLMQILKNIPLLEYKKIRTRRQKETKSGIFNVNIEKQATQLASPD